MVRPGTDRPSLLLVSTVSVTIRHFLRPYADHFRSLGWRVDAAEGVKMIVGDGLVAIRVGKATGPGVIALRGDVKGLVRGERRKLQADDQQCCESVRAGEG